MKPENHEMSVLLTRLTNTWPYLSPDQTWLLRLRAQWACMVAAFSRLPSPIQHGVLTSAFAFVAMSLLPSPATLPRIILPVLWCACYSAALAVVSWMPSERGEIIQR